MPLFRFFNTQTVHINANVKSVVPTHSVAINSNKTLHPRGFQTRTFFSWGERNQGKCDFMRP
jgi:hypothetical protein